MNKPRLNKFQLNSRIQDANGRKGTVIGPRGALTADERTVNELHIEWDDDRWHNDYVRASKVELLEGE